MLSVICLTSETACNDMIRIAARAGLTCTANTHKLDEPEFSPIEFLKRVIGRGHESVIEHINFSFSIKGISRALLQELARHRHISLSVESTRWTLGKKDLKDRFDQAISIANKHIPPTAGRLRGKMTEWLAYLEWRIENHKLEADDAKYFLPEFYPTNLVMTCNLRELRHIFSLRANPPALKEFNELCAAIKETLPLDIVRLLDVKEATS